MKTLKEQLASNPDAVTWQFFEDGEWHTGEHVNNHYENTVQAGFPVRLLYCVPQIPSKIPEGYALIAIEVLQAWGKLNEVRSLARYPVYMGDKL